MSSAVEINLPEIVAEVTQQFYLYEHALISNDLQVLDQLFWHHDKTVRLGAGENLYGIEQIRAFRNARPADGLDRQLYKTVITTFGKHYATCSTEFRRSGSLKCGRQQQSWVKFAEGWRIVAAQVSLIPG